jgi:ectoine hydroxylase-related dioxygenase (phytanoyl-CoA dioxygenase family)
VAKLPTAEDVSFFQEQGYWIGDKVLSDDFVARMHKAMDQVFAGQWATGNEPWMGGWQETGDPTAIRKTDNSHWANPVIAELVHNPTIGAMAAALMQTPQVRLWHDQLLYKPGQGGQAASAAGNVGWHQDHGYWQCTCTDLITAWVALVDVPEERGCMYFVPGSHKWGLLEHSDFFNTDLAGMQAKIESLSGKPFEKVPVELKAGQVSFHHCLTIHGSGPNVTDQPRRSLVLHVMPQHAAYIAGSPNDNHMNAILMQQLGKQDGDLFEGEYWPVVYP